MNKDDRLIWLAKIAFGVLIPFTGIFGPLLIIFSEATRNFWAWEITPAMSSVWVGAGYTFGAVAITTTIVLGRWRTASLPTVATFPFSIGMLGATLLHLDRFFLGTLPFYIWLIIYIYLPIGLPLIYILNRGRDPGVQPNDLMVPRPLALGAGLGGVLITLFGLFMFFSPTALAESWPWRLTPLMSRVIGSWILFIGMAAMWLLFERRYIAYRYFLPCAAFWFALLFVAALFHLDNFFFDRPSAWIFFVVLGVAVVGLMVDFLYFERRYRAQVSRPSPLAAQS
jgi:hypothetical protein